MIYQEAGNQGDEGMRGVAFVAQNRHGSPNYPSTYYDVIVGSGAFTVALKYKGTGSQAEKDNYDACYKIANSMSSQTNPIGTRLFFCMLSSVTGLNKDKGNGSYTGKASVSFTNGLLIKDHIFYS